MRNTLKIQKVIRDKESKCSWPHWFTLRDLERLRQEIDEAICSKKNIGDAPWPYVYEPK